MIVSSALIFVIHGFSASALTRYCYKIYLLKMQCKENTFFPSYEMLIVKPIKDEKNNSFLI